jgi:hypothetical protein
MSNQISPQQVDEFWLKLALILIDKGMGMLKKAFHLSPSVLTADEITQILRKYFPTQSIVHLDNRYQVIPIEQWRELIRADWTDTKNWVLDFADCDNFANYFSANMSMFYEINSVGRVYGKLYKGTDKFLGYHYWNVIITSNKEIWFFEPQSDKLEETNYQGGTLLLGGNKYEPLSFMFG